MNGHLELSIAAAPPPTLLRKKRFPFDLIRFEMPFRQNKSVSIWALRKGSSFSAFPFLFINKISTQWDLNDQFIRLFVFLSHLFFFQIISSSLRFRAQWNYYYSRYFVSQSCLQVWIKCIGDCEEIDIKPKRRDEAWMSWCTHKNPLDELLVWTNERMSIRYNS